jgi:NAD(P)-dependent dehydrogenase (short-subunit alcohol dehydrogenase family)
MSADTSQQLRSRTLVVTGASSGIGAAATRHFVERGATVAVVGRSPRNTAVIGNRRGRSRRAGGRVCSPTVGTAWAVGAQASAEGRGARPGPGCSESGQA